MVQLCLPPPKHFKLNLLSSVIFPRGTQKNHSLNHTHRCRLLWRTYLWEPSLDISSYWHGRITTATALCIVQSATYVTLTRNICLTPHLTMTRLSRWRVTNSSASTKPSSRT